MLVESIILAIFLCSLGGIVVILARKLPALNTLPQNGSTGFKKNQIVLEVEGRIKNFYSFFARGIILHKVLSWSKCQIIKAETWIDEVLHGLRKKAKEEKLNGKK